MSGVQANAVGYTQENVPQERPHGPVINKKKVFLAAIRAGGSVTLAAKAAGCDRRTHYKWLARKPKYAEDFALALQDNSRKLRKQAKVDADEVELGLKPKKTGRNVGPGYPEVRAAVLVRDGLRCSMCDFTEFLNVHHIVACCKGGSSTPNNLISLCPNHHAMAHRGTLSESLLLDLVRKREPAPVRKRIKHAPLRCDCGKYIKAYALKLRHVCWVRHPGD